MPPDPTLDVLVFSAPALADGSVAIAAARAGATGVVDLAGHNALSAQRELDRLTRGCERGGARLEADLSPVPGELDLRHVKLLVLAGFATAALKRAAAAAHALGQLVLAEVTSVAAAAEAERAGVDGLIARGHEAGGMVGDETSYILLQRLRRVTALPVWVAGGVGPHSAAGCLAAGARGVVLERQLALTLESALPAEVRGVFERLDGSETGVVGAALGWPLRVLDRPHGLAGVEALARVERELADGGLAPKAREKAWREAIRARLGYGEDQVAPLGMEVGFAAGLAARGRTVAGVIDVYRASLRDSLRLARELAPLAPHSPLAASHGTEFPVTQGPMTRVSDTAAFALAVAEGGGLPFVALALLDGERSLKLLQETRQALGERPWGVGILGFVPPELRAVQLEAVGVVKPPFALIAGGRPTQARELENDGIPTFLHVPSPRLLASFLKDGATRFVFEGRECGGHIGPRSSFVLWDQAVETILEHLGDKPADALHLLFAGGIHDEFSAAAVAATAAPLAARGAKIGVLVGTGYLFTHEAVTAGAIVEQFQAEALGCAGTAVIETSPGHAIRVVHTPAVDEFRARKRELEAQGLGPREVGAELERMNLGRLRIASRGVNRNPAHETDPTQPRYVSLEAEEQRSQGLYMVGQVAALRDGVVSIRELHAGIARCAEVLPEAAAGLQPPAVVDPRTTAIAIVGMAAMLPGATDVDQYWENILNRVDSVTEVPRDRWDPDIYFDPDTRGGDHTYSKWGGFLADVPFDPLEFGIPPRSLYTIEPVHLLALEVTKRALRDAGYERRSYPRERTAVVFGAGGGSSDLSNAFGFRGQLAHFFSAKPGLPDATQLLAQIEDSLPQWCEDTFPGVLVNVIAGRVANRFNFGGANFTVDAACASSLAAVDAAVKELQLGHADVAIAGGADTTQDIFSYLLFSNSLVLSPRGRCRTFDETADGIAIGEGVAAVVLKRLADAERDGDHIYAVIRGIAGSSDGRALGLTAPNLAGQARAVRMAYEHAQLSPGSVELVEAHGTGTAVGDRTEVEALASIFQAAGAAVGQVAIGSVKSNIGHTKCAAGLASLIKTALAIDNRVLPPTLHVETPNRRAGFGSNPFYPNRELRPWLNGRHDHPRRAAVSAFGFGGTNFHLVMEEYSRGHLPKRAATVHRSSELLIWRAADTAELVREVTRLIEALTAGAEPELRDLAWSLSLRAGRRSGGVTLAIVAATRAALPEQLALALELLKGEAQPEAAALKGVYHAAQPLLSAGGKLALLFPGQGSQSPFMLSELAVHFEPVREALERADLLLEESFPQGLSRYLYPPSAYTKEDQDAQAAALTATEVAQPALGACSAALLHLLRAFGVGGDLAAGHSYGEYVALYAAGCIDYETLLRLSVARGRAIADAGGDLHGGMVAVRADAAATEAALAGVDGITLANHNSPQQTVIAGSDAALEQALARLKERGLQARHVPVSCAFHSPLVAPAAERLHAALDEAGIGAGAFPVYSNTTAAPHTPETVVEDLARHLVSPVRFVDEITAMADAGATLFVEVGPGRVLTGLVERILEGRPCLAVPSDGKAGVDRLHHLLAQLFVHGAELTLDPLFAGRETTTLELERLAETTRPVPPSSTTWMVCGGRARPLQALPPGDKPAPRTAPKPLVAPPAEPAVAAPPAPAPATGGVLEQFQATMRQALEQQQRMVREAIESQQKVMTTYLAAQQAVLSAWLGGAPVEGAVLPELPPAPAPAAKPEAEPEPETPPAPEAAPAAPALDLTALLLRLVSERTGYPPDMIGLDLDMEAELGIDSIKRIEILSGVQEQLPSGVSAGLEEGLEDLAQQKTIRQAVAWLEQRVLQSAAAPAAEAESLAPAVASPVARHVVRAVDAAAIEQPRALAKGGVVVLCGSGPLAGAVAAELRARGLVAVPGEVPESEAAADKLLKAARRKGKLSGLVLLAPDAGEGELAGLAQMDLVGRWFLLAKTAAPALAEAGGKGFGILALSAVDGAFGLAGGPACPLAGGLGGLAKALAHELPAVVVKSVDVPRRGDPAKSAARAVAEQLGGDPTVEVGLSGARRVTLRCVEEPARGQGVTLGKDDLVLVTGGARGITAEIAVALAERFGVRLALLGRTAVGGQESASTRGLTDLAAVKAALAKDLTAGGTRPAPAEIEQAYRKLTAEREVRATLERLHSAGAQAEAYAVDVRDGEAVRALLGKLGKVTALVHGAGTIEDRRLADKTPEQFARVFGTKVDGARVLLEALDLDALKLAVFFTSVAGRFGNVGQTDYAAANEVLAKLARRLDGSRAARVVSVAWGPWDEVGMVQPELRKRMRERGVTLVTPEVGVRLLLDEIARGAKGEAEVVMAALGDDPGQVL